MINRMRRHGGGRCMEQHGGYDAGVASLRVSEGLIGTHTDGFWPHKITNKIAIPVPGGMARDNLLIVYGYCK